MEDNDKKALDSREEAPQPAADPKEGEATLVQSTFTVRERAPRGKLHAFNWLDRQTTVNSCKYVMVQFKNTRCGYYENVSRLPLKIGDTVVVEASPGHDVGQVMMVGPLVARQMRRVNLKEDPKKIFRIARPADLEKFEEAKAREQDTMIRSRKIAESLELNMKIGDVEYQGDGGKAIFYYIADERVDFRKLIRILADTFKIRIEMRQIGARQEAGRIGGIGPCGRPLCCSSWMTRFVSVGTTSARAQDLSMNPQKLAGQCAKLKCCLNFEVDSYMEAQKKLPPKDAVLSTKDGDFYLFKTDILSRMLTYSSDKSVAANLVTIPARRAFEIIALNKQGIQVDSLAEDAKSDRPKKEYVDLATQESLTRFDKAKRKKKRKQKPSADAKGEAPRQEKPNKPKRPNTNPNPNQNQKQRRPNGNDANKPKKQPEGPKNQEG